MLQAGRCKNDLPEFLITGTFPTGQVAVRVDIVKRDGDGNARLQVFSPVGMYLPKPARLTIDQGEPHSVPYTWGLTNACIAGAVADPKIIKEMASGQTLRLEFVDLSLLDAHDVAAAWSVRGVHNGAPSQRLNRTSMNERKSPGILRRELSRPPRSAMGREWLGQVGDTSGLHRG